MSPKATRILHSQGLNRDKYGRLARLAALFGQVRKDVRGVSAAPQSPHDIRDAWMAEDYDWHGWVKGVMAGTLTATSRRRGSALVLVNPAYISQTDSRTGLWQGYRRWDRFHCRDGAVLDADTNAACNIPARLYDSAIALYMPYRAVRALLAERTRTGVGTAPPGLKLPGLATMLQSTESKLPRTHKV